MARASRDRSCAPFVCEIMDMDAGATDGTPVADRTSRLLAAVP